MNFDEDTEGQTLLGHNNTTSTASSQTALFTGHNNTNTPKASPEGTEADLNTEKQHIGVDDPTAQPMFESRKDQLKRMLPAPALSFIRRVRYYVPLFQWIPKYRREYFIGDLTAGLTVAVALIPGCIAYSVLAGLPPVMGLNTALFGILLYWPLANSMHLAVGPCTTVSILLASNLQDAATPEEAATNAVVMAFLCGCFTLGMGLLRLGFFDNILSRPLFRGFISAIALITTLEQLDTFMGIPSSAHSYFKIPYIFTHANEIQWLPLMMGLATLFILFGHKFLKAKFPKSFVIKMTPAMMVVIIVGVVFSYAFDFEKKGLKLVGDIPQGLPVPQLPLITLDRVRQIAMPAVIVSIIGFVEAIVVSKSFASKHQYYVSANRELVAFGVANIVGSFFNMYPVFASATRTAINDSAGGKTPISSVISAIVVVLTMIFLTPLFYYLPKAAVSGIILYAASGLIELDDIIFLLRLKAWKELGILVFTFASTFILGAESGLILSAGVSVLMVIRTTSQPAVAILRRSPTTPSKFEDLITFKDINVFMDRHQWVIQPNSSSSNNVAESVAAGKAYGTSDADSVAVSIEASTATASKSLGTGGVLMVRIEESLYFANIMQVKELLRKIEKRAHVNAKLSTIVIDARNIITIDASAIQVLMEMVDEYRVRDITILWVKLREENKQLFIRSGLMDKIGAHHLFYKNGEALEYLEKGRVVSHSTYKDIGWTKNAAGYQAQAEAQAQAADEAVQAARSSINHQYTDIESPGDSIVPIADSGSKRSGRGKSKKPKVAASGSLNADDGYANADIDSDRHRGDE